MIKRPSAVAAVLFVATLGQGSGRASEVDPPIHDCDRLAASPYDDSAVALPVSVVELDAEKAVQACSKALMEFPGTHRFYAQLGRALHEVGRKEDAVEAYREAADQGHVYAMAVLGIFYAQGDGVPEDDARAVEWLHEAADRSPLASAWLGRMYAEGEGVRRSHVEAAKYFQKAVAWYRNAAQYGFAEAQATLGWMYSKGFGVPPYEVEAIKWFRKAAEQGLATAQSWLGSKYAMGQGVPQDYAMALSFFEEAAARGDAVAQNWLGWMYAQGEGVAQDYAQAAKWFEKAAEQGRAHAQYELGRLYAEGNGVPQDRAKATELYRRAAERGDVAAQRALETLETTE